MCTSLAFTGSHPCFGRNLDLEESFGEQIVITPRSFSLTFRRLPCQKNHYAIIGMAHVAGGVPLYAEAVNEKGLYMAGLNFPGNARYFPHADDGAAEAAPYELIPWLLGQCATIEETKDLLERLRLLDEPFAPGLPSAPLHCRVAGKPLPFCPVPLSLRAGHGQYGPARRSVPRVPLCPGGFL